MNIKRIVTTVCQENCYVIWDDNKKCGIIDPGGDIEKIITFIEKNEIYPECILLTHGHFDHIGAAEELRNKYNIKIFVCEKEMVIVNEGGISFGMPFDIPKKVSFVKENDEITVGDIVLKVLETPGHTIGSVCYLSDNVLFSGDTLFLDTVGRWDFYTGNFDVLYNSVVNKLFKLSPDIKVYPGHGFSTTISYEKDNNCIYNY